MSKKECEKNGYHRFKVEEWQAVGDHKVRYKVCKDCGKTETKRINKLPFKK